MIQSIWKQFEKCFEDKSTKIRHKLLNVDLVFDDEEQKLHTYGAPFCISFRVALEQLNNEVVPIIHIHTAHFPLMRNFIDNEGLITMQLLQTALKAEYERLMCPTQ